MARGGIYTADLAAKEKGIRKGEKREGEEKKRKAINSFGAPRCLPSQAPPWAGLSLFIVPTKG